MNIRVAIMEDIDRVLDVYAEAREYMAQNGNAEQWGKNYPPKSLIEDDISKGKCYIVEDINSDGGRSIQGVFYFAIERDVSYDIIEEGQWRNNRPYAVVHRIAVGALAHNKGLAGQCISYAVNRCREVGIYDLRMDTHKDNIPMQRFLEKCDFRRCGKVYVENDSERLAYHKIIIRNVVFDVGQVLLEFDWRKFIKDMNIGEEKEAMLINVTLGNIPHWNWHDRGMDDEEFIRKSLELEPGIENELKHYMANIGTCVKEYEYAVPLIKELKSKGFDVYILSNYGRTPFKYAKDNMKFFDEVDGMVISHEVGMIKPEPEIYELLYSRYDLVPGECLFLDDRADNIDAAIKCGMSGIVFVNIEQALKELCRITGTKIIIN